MSWIGRLFGAKEKKPAPPAPPGRASAASGGRDSVAVLVPLPKSPPACDAETARLAGVQSDLEAAVRGLGGLATGQSVDGWFVVCFEGDDAEAMWEALAPVIERHTFPRGSHVIKRAALTGGQERIRIEWNG